MKGLIEDFEGNKYTLGNFAEFGGMTCVTDGVKQYISVANSLRRGQKWKDPRFFMLDKEELLQDFGGVTHWKLEKYSKTEDTLEIEFSPIMPKEDTKVMHPGDQEKIREFLMKVEMNKENFRQLIRNMLVRVFMKEDLQRLLDSEDIQFGIDEYWMYLLCKDTAYRV